MQQHLFEHFLEEGHHRFLEDVSITLIHKTDPSNPFQRKSYWRSTLKAMAPWGLNFEDRIWNGVLLYFATGFKRVVISTRFTETIFWYQWLLFLLSSLSLLLLFSLPFCSYCCYLCNCGGVLLVIIGVCVIVAAIVVIFVVLLLLLHYCFVIFNIY